MKDIIIYTDIGDDIDDTLALWFANRSWDIRSLIIVLSGHETEKRINTWNSIKEYMTIPYSLVIWSDSDCDTQVSRLIQPDRSYNILWIGPLTECTRHISNNVIPHNAIASITIQAWITPNNNQPDWWRVLHEESRNLKTDLQAAQFFNSSFLEHNIPINWIGKYAAYEIGLSKERMHNLASSDNSWFEKLIEQQAYHRQQIFSLKNPQKYNEIYWSHPNIISFPYDLIALISILYPQLLYWEEYAWYKTIWHIPWKRISNEIYMSLWVDYKE